MATPTHASHAVVARRLDELDETTAFSAGSLLAKVWPRPDRRPEDRAEQLLSRGRGYDGPSLQAPTSMLVFDPSDDAERPSVIAHALAFPRTIGFDAGGEPSEMTVLALAMVATDPDRRGEGLGALVVNAVFRLVDKGVYPYSLYQTSFPVQPFYERLGACRVNNPIKNSAWTPASRAATRNDNPFWDDLVMRYPAERGPRSEPWPEGEIDLRGEGY